MVPAEPPEPDAVRIINGHDPEPERQLPAVMERQGDDWLPLIGKLLEFIDKHPEVLQRFIPGMTVPTSPPPQTVNVEQVAERRRVEAWETGLTLAPPEWLRRRGLAQLDQLTAWLKAVPDQDVRIIARRVLAELDDRDVQTVERIMAVLGAPSDS
jgi:hypothetical protein